MSSWQERFEFAVTISDGRGVERLLIEAESEAVARWEAFKRAPGVRWHILDVERGARV